MCILPFDLSHDKVTWSLTELKTTIDAGLVHRGNLLQAIGDQFEQWNQLVYLLFLKNSFYVQNSQMSLYIYMIHHAC